MDTEITADVEMQDNEDELKKAIAMSLVDNAEEEKQAENDDDEPLGAPSTVRIKTYDITYDLLLFFKDEILTCAESYDVLKADLVVYLFTRLIRNYGKVRSSISSEKYDLLISDCIIDLLRKVILE